MVYTSSGESPSPGGGGVVPRPAGGGPGGGLTVSRGGGAVSPGGLQGGARRNASMSSAPKIVRYSALPGSFPRESDLREKEVELSSGSGLEAAEPYRNARGDPHRVKSHSDTQCDIRISSGIYRGFTHGSRLGPQQGTTWGDIVSSGGSVSISSEIHMYRDKDPHREKGGEIK